MAKSDYLPETFIQTLRQEIAGYNSFPEKYQMAVARLIWGSDSKRRQHKGFDGHISISRKEIRTRFGRNGFVSMNDRLHIFEATPNWSVEYSETKGYRLTKKVQMIKDKYLAPHEEHTTALVYLDDSGKLKTLRSLLESIASKQDDEPSGITDMAWRDTRIMSKTPVDIPALMRLYIQLTSTIRAAQICQSPFSESETAAINRRIEGIGKLIKLAQTDLAGRGYVAVRYAACSTGRLYAGGVSLQTMPRIVRETALQGLWDYDIENCNFAIFEQMAARFGYQADAIRYYLEHKNEVRHGIAGRVGISIDQAKTCLLAVLQGAKLMHRKGNSIPRTIGPDKAISLYADNQFRVIAEDADVGRGVILGAWAKNRGTLMNDLGKVASLDKSKAVLMAHLLQGVEAKALKAAVNLYPDEIALLMHDGLVVTKPIDVDLVEREMFDKTGYRLTLSGRQIMPME